jgi:hypothetical protein
MAEALDQPIPFDDAASIDPNHHLWRNGRLWWIAFTVHRGPQQERVRFSLGTPDIEEARRRRDRALALFESARNCRVSLRFAPRRRNTKPARTRGERGERHS